MNSFRIVESFQIFKNQLVCLLIITDFKAIEPFTFDNRMKGFNACIIPRKSFLRVATLHIFSCFFVFLCNILAATIRMDNCSRSKFLTKLLKTFDKTFREIFPVFISTKRREKPSAFFDNNFVNNAYFSEAASSSSSHLASSSSKAPISSRMTCLCLWSS